MSKVLHTLAPPLFPPHHRPSIEMHESSVGVILQTEERSDLGAPTPSFWPNGLIHKVVRLSGYQVTQ